MSEQPKLCAECDQVVPAQACVTLNGRDLHAIGCFDVGLRRLVSTLEAAQLDVDQLVPVDSIG